MDSHSIPRLLLLPGWHGSGPNHWQSRWHHKYADQIVEQGDWLWPRRGDWMARLDEVVQRTDAPIAFVAHSLGAQLVASWAAKSVHVEQVLAALLVAPADTERPDMPVNLFNWRPISQAHLPFRSTIVASSDDPFCSLERSMRFAKDWGSQLINIGPHGHINAESGLGDWDVGRQILISLLGEQINPRSSLRGPTHSKKS